MKKYIMAASAAGPPEKESKKMTIKELREEVREKVVSRKKEETMVLTELLKLSDAYQIGIENLMNEDGIKIVRKGEQFAEYSLHKGIIIRYAWKPHTLDEYVAAIEADDRLTPAFKKQREKLNKADFTAVKRFYERWKVSAVPETAKYTAVFGASYSGEGGTQYLYAIEAA